MDHQRVHICQRLIHINMFYKKINDEWYYGMQIHLPSGEILNEENKSNSDGWEWMDSPPLDFENNLVNS